MKQIDTQALAGEIALSPIFDYDGKAVMLTALKGVEEWPQAFECWVHPSF